jgi:hypothetical protein
MQLERWCEVIVLTASGNEFVTNVKRVWDMHFTFVNVSNFDFLGFIIILEDLEKILTGRSFWKLNTRVDNLDLNCCNVKVIDICILFKLIQQKKNISVSNRSMA